MTTKKKTSSTKQTGSAAVTHKKKITKKIAGKTTATEVLTSVPLPEVMYGATYTQTFHDEEGRDCWHKMEARLSMPVKAHTEEAILEGFETVRGMVEAKLGKAVLEFKEELEQIKPADFAEEEPADFAEEETKDEQEEGAEEDVGGDWEEDEQEAEEDVGGDWEEDEEASGEEEESPNEEEEESPNEEEEGSEEWDDEDWDLGESEEDEEGFA